jgi:hypothetical protein
LFQRIDLYTAKPTSPHIFNTLANLLGFCLIVFYSLHIPGSSKSTLIDEFNSLIALLLAVSSVLSFSAIRTGRDKRERQLENTADLLFLLNLSAIVLLILFLTLRLCGH